MRAFCEPAFFPMARSHLIPESADRPGNDPIFTLNAQAKSRRAEGEDVLDSTLGALMEDEGSLAIMPVVCEQLRAVDPRAGASYAPIAGDERFLRAVRRDLFGRGALFERSVAAATPGGTGACDLAIVNWLETGQSLLSTSFYWGPYGTIARHSGRALATFGMFNAEGRLDVAALEEEARRLMDEQGRVLVVLNTPCHNPTGYSMDDGDWEGVDRALAALARRGPITLLLDFAYEKFSHSSACGESAADWRVHVQALVDADVDVVVAWTASKAFLQYGSRVGACVAIPADRGNLESVGNALSFSCRGTWSNCNHLGMLAIANVLEDDELRARADAERDTLRKLLDERVQAFNRCAREVGLEYPRYDGGFFVSVFAKDAQGTAARMRAEGVFVVPLQGAVRIAVCATPLARIARLVDSLARALGASSSA